MRRSVDKKTRFQLCQNFKFSQQQFYRSFNFSHRRIFGPGTSSGYTGSLGTFSYLWYLDRVNPYTSSFKPLPPPALLLGLAYNQMATNDKKQGGGESFQRTMARIRTIQSHLSREPRGHKLSGKVCVITGVGSKKGIGWVCSTLFPSTCY